METGANTTEIEAAIQAGMEAAAGRLREADDEGNLRPFRTSWWVELAVRGAYEAWFGVRTESERDG